MGGLGAPELVLLFIAAFLCFLPAIIGYREGAKRTIGSIAGLLLGFFFSIIGVIIVFCSPRIDEQKYYFNAPSSADELKKYKELLDSGAITESEYNTQKEKILTR